MHNDEIGCFSCLTDVVTDAMGIYSTYIALNALTPVHIPDDIRQRVEGKIQYCTIPISVSHCIILARF